MKNALVSTEILDKIWNQWLDQQELTKYERLYVLGRPYDSTVQRSNKVDRFQIWLFNQGGSIRRINKKFYIEFSDPSQASFFLLRHS